MHPFLRDITFTHQWADEDLGANCGERTYENGELVQEYFPEGVEAMDYALSVWDYDPLDLDICKNASGTRYIGIEDEAYELIEILDKPALFANEKLTNADIPEGMYCYQLRADDDGESEYKTVEKSVVVNRSGSIVLKEPLEFGNSDVITLDDDSAPNFTGEEYTFGQFMRDDFGLSEANEQTLSI